MRYDSLVEGFILKQQPMGEADVLATWFTRELGKVRGVVAGGRRPQSRLAGSLLPGTVLHLRLVARHDKGLFTLAGTREARVLIPKFSEVQMLVYVWILESVAKAMPDMEPNAVLFDLATASFERIALMYDADIAFVCAGFLVRLLHVLGIAPQPAEQPAGVRWFDQVSGRFVEQAAPAGLPVLAETYERYMSLLQTGADAPADADAAVVRLLEHVLERYLERQVRSFSYVNDIL